MPALLVNAPANRCVLHGPSLWSWGADGSMWYVERGERDGARMGLGYGYGCETRLDETIMLGS